MKRRELGQHYLVDREVVQRIVSAAAIESGEVVLEIGTGRGALTRQLVGLGKELRAYELDPLNFEETKKIVAGRRVDLHLDDAFRVSPKFDVLVSSLPYSRSAEFVEWLSQRSFKRAVVVLQEDFVKKITSPAGDRDYRAISVIAQTSSTITLGDRIPRSAFSPEPRVNSRIVRFVPGIRLNGHQLSAIKRLFALRRRTLSSALGVIGSRGAGRLLDTRRRVFQLSPAEVYLMVSRVSTAGA
jgi:16S rRNA (adenine1518-N6/adenine1519-N6)-dimethyltransferase